jgi:voltage-gated potassium channel
MDNLQDWRQRLYIIIFFTNTPSGQRFDRYLLLAIMTSLVVVMLDSIEAVRHSYGDLLVALEWFFTAMFAIEYALRIYISPKPREYIFSFYGIIDLLAVLPAFIVLIYADAQYLLIIRVIRMLRVFRVFKLSPYLSQANFLLTALQGSKQKIIVFFACIATMVTVFGTLMYVIEGPAHGFTSIPKGIYWAVVTLTTVGYGDIVPKTPLGQALSTLVMITGYSIIAVPTGIFTAELASAMRGDGQTQHPCPSCNKSQHEVSASFCNRCGNSLFTRQNQKPESGDSSNPSPRAGKNNP